MQLRISKHCHVTLDREGFDIEGHYWPFNNYWAHYFAGVAHTWRKPPDVAGDNWRWVNRDHAFCLYWSKRWPFIGVGECY